MEKKKRKFYTVGQIDATGVRGPHEKELEDISMTKYPLFIDLAEDTLRKIVSEELGANLENIGFNEDWTITIEMFPEVYIHIAYSYFGDEFGDSIEAEFKYYWVPGEDSATFIDIVMDFLERRIKQKDPFEKSYETKTDLMKKVLIQRNEPFNLLTEDDEVPLADFIGGKVRKMSNGWKIEREVFPEIFINLIWTEQDGLDIVFSGEKLSQNIGNYHIELVGIFTINHVLRYITINNDEKELPDICYIMFSRLFTKEKGWDHRTR